jgi:methylmalonyl-CoA/ethylmalonyl-CoA epimerase
MVIDHIGIVVKSLENGIDSWNKLFGYKQATKIVTNTRQKVKVVFMEKPGSLQVKLLEPTDPSSPVFALSIRGGGLHHICFRDKCLSEGLKSLVEKGVRVLVPPEPGEAFDNENIAFVYVNNCLNIELIDTEKRAGRIQDGELNPRQIGLLREG